MARRFGLGEALGIELVGEMDGLVPSKDWKLAVTGVPWQMGETLITGIGQAYLLATPLQLQLVKEDLKQFIVPPNTAESNWAKQESKVINQIPVHIVSVQGTYLKSRMPMMMDGPKIELKDYALLAVIAETNTGLWFFKVTGPQKTVKFWEKDFDTFINTFRLN